MRLGLEGEIPAHYPALKVRPGVEVRRWPQRYLTPRVLFLLALWKLRRRGHAVREDGCVHWPTPLVEALFVLDNEMPKERDA